MRHLCGCRASLQTLRCGNALASRPPSGAATHPPTQHARRNGVNIAFAGGSEKIYKAGETFIEEAGQTIEGGITAALRSAILRDSCCLRRRADYRSHVSSA